MGRTKLLPHFRIEKRYNLPSFGSLGRKARSASGREFLSEAKEMLAEARTVEAFRQARALVLPLEHGFSMERVAAIAGVSRG